MASNVLDTWVVEMKAVGDDLVAAAAEKVQVGLAALPDEKRVRLTVDAAASALDPSSGAASKSLAGAFAAGKQGAQAPAVPKELLAAQKELQSELAELARLYQLGALSADYFGARSAVALENAEAKAKKLGEALVAQQKQTAAVGSAFATLSGTLGGWIRQGLQGTAEAEMFAVQWQRSMREIANVFAPVIRAVVDGMSRISAALRSLTGDQQNAAAKWIAIGVAALGAVVVLPKVLAGFEGIKLALTGLMAHPVIAIAGALAMLVMSTEEGQAAFGELVKAFAPLLEVATTIFVPIISAIAEIAGELASTLAPAIKAIGVVLTVAFAPLKWILGLFKGGAVQFGAPSAQGGRQLRELQGGDRAETDRARQEEINRIRDQSRTSLADVAELRERTGMGTGWARAATETQRDAIANQMQTELDRQRAQANRGRNELTQRGGGFEGAQESYRRIQTAINRTDPAQQQREQTNSWLSQMFSLQQRVRDILAQGLGQAPGNPGP